MHIAFFMVLMLPLIGSGQSHEFGFSLGASNFWGDLGGANRVGRPLFFDLELGLTRPVWVLCKSLAFCAKGL